jgi:hypothetical protein
MKRFVFVLFVFFMFGVLSASQVTNLRATAIAHDGFTARWDALSPAESCDLEVKQGFASFFDFEGSSEFPGAWSIQNATIFDNAVYAHTGQRCAVINRLNGYAQTGVVSNPGTVSFFARVPASSNVLTTKLQISSDGSVWTDLLTLQAISGNLGNLRSTYTRYQVGINLAGTYRLRFVVTAINSGSFILDDLQYTELCSLDSVSQVSTEQPVIRVNQLSAETDYIFRAKPASGQYSDWINVQTISANSGQSAGTAIIEQPAQMSVTADNGSSYQNIAILPASPGIYDYSVQAQLIESSFAYTIACEDGTALNAAYSISHPGLNVIGCTTSSGQITEYSSVNEITSFTVSGLGGKANLTLYLETGDTLPVQLSSFFVNYLAGTSCLITWLSQSESQLRGYHVLRSASSLLDDAEYISPLIPATNSSQPSAYSYTDSEAVLPAYYWLLASDYDGDEHYYGPVYQNKPESSDNAQVPEINGLSVFPNPAGESVSLQLKLEQMQLLDFTVYNSKGQMVERGSLGVCPEGDFQRILPIQRRLPSGVYFLVLEGKDFQLKEKFVIQK